MATINNPWTVNLRVEEVKLQIHQTAFEATQEVFELDIIPEAKRLSPVSIENPKILPKPKIVTSKTGKTRIVLRKPYRDTGHNRRNIDATVTDTPNGPEAELFTTSGYGGYLEVGTSKMAARPYLWPAFSKFIGNLSKLISVKLKQV
jgi:hypothetical protein